MKALVQVVLAGVILIGSALYVNSTTHNYKIVDSEEDDEPDPTSEFVSDFSVIGLLGKEALKIKQEKDVAELELYRKNEKAEKIKKSEGIERDKRLISKGVSRSVPKSNTSMKSYMSWKKITNKSSKQYQLQKRDDVYTDSEGFRKIGDRFLVAVGTYYGNIGDNLRIKLDSGMVFEAKIGDIKDNNHTDNKNRQHLVDKSVIEYIIDMDKLDKTIKKMGDCSFSSENKFQGNVISIEVFEGLDD